MLQNVILRCHCRYIQIVFYCSKYFIVQLKTAVSCVKSKFILIFMNENIKYINITLFYIIIILYYVIIWYLYLYKLTVIDMQYICNSLKIKSTLLKTVSFNLSCSSFESKSIFLESEAWLVFTGIDLKTW